MPADPAPNPLAKIQHFVVLMLENRSFDHLLGFLKSIDPRVAGLSGGESNSQDPASPQSPKVTVSRATSFGMPFDPGHEFDDVQTQLYAPSASATYPAAMGGFLKSAVRVATAAHMPLKATRIMECFEPDQVTVMTALAQEFALFNYWYSSLPGPTWPNRFFVHAATSGGLTDSPGTAQIVSGFSFPKKTIYDALEGAGKDWRIYHDGLPQAAGIANLRLEYIDPFTKHFLKMDSFADDVKAGSLPEYTFIEPRYDTGNNYLGGNSMHPLSDVRNGERLIKQVYEALRNSSLWDKVMLIVTFDEHGGSFDHLPPQTTVPTGDDARYANPARPFDFDILGVRVPAIVVSAYTKKGTVIGTDPQATATVFDHSSIVATVGKRFGFPALTNRDSLARTLDVALNLDAPRLTPADAPTSLPKPKADTVASRILGFFRKPAAAPAADAPLSTSQQNHLDLALACDLAISQQSQARALRDRHARIRVQRDADAYIREVEDKIHARRR